MKKLNEILVYMFLIGASGCLIAMCIVLFGR